eukprot:8455469-Alexandrium_andersonii.AAC.1
MGSRRASRSSGLALLCSEMNLPMFSSNARMLFSRTLLGNVCSCKCFPKASSNGKTVPRAWRPSENCFEASVNAAKEDETVAKSASDASWDRATNSCASRSE